MRNTVLKFSGFLLAGILIGWWLGEYTPLNLPNTIPGTQINIRGLLLGGFILTVLIIAQKEFLKSNPESGILRLTILGTSICFIAEIIFQAMRQPFLNADTFNEHLYYYLLGTIGVSAFAAIFSFFVAFQLKTKKTRQLVLIIIVFVVVVNIIKYFFPSFLYDSN